MTTDNQFLRAYVTLQVAALSWSSLSMLCQGPQAFDAPFGPKYATEWGWVWAHSVSALLVLVLGPWLLWRLPGHRLCGRIYLISSLLAGVSGLPLSLRAEGGWGGRLSFLILDSLWLRAAWSAYATARQRQWKRHLDWVQVHYLLAWSAVFFRLGLGATAQLGIPLQQVALPLAWLSWQPGFWLAYRRGLITK
ncbi:MAG: DUF2306 domain-containing protein [Vulcanimicrobiota bacterium]